MADLHRLPHRLGDAGPGRVDQRASRRARDEDPRQVEQQRRVLVAARMKPGQRHQQFAAAQIDVADQVEGGIGRDEAVIAIRPQQMRAAVADRGFDLGEAWHAPRRGCGRGSRVLQLDGIQEVRHRLADRSPVRRHIVARLDQRVAERAQTSLIAQFGKPGPSQQRPQCRISQRRPVEFAEMGVAAAIFQQQRIAHIIERGAVLAGRQRAVGAGEMLKNHGESSRARRCRFREAMPGRNARCRPPRQYLQALEKLHE